MPVTYEPIATQTLGSSAASITFSSIAATWTDLRIVLNNIYSSTAGSVEISFNGVPTGTLNSWTYLAGNGTTADSSRASSQPSINVNRLGTVVAGTISLFTFDVFSYAGSTNKTCLVSSSEDRNGTGNTNVRVGLWRSTAAITSIVLTSAMAAGTTATLYGIKAA